MSRKKYNKRLLVEFFLAGLIIVLVFGARSVYGSVFIEGTSTQVESKPQEVKVETKTKYNDEQMTGAINNIVAGYEKNEDSKISVVYRNLKTGYRYAKNDREYFPMASTTKVLYAMDVYDRIKNGDLKEDQEIPYKAAYAMEGNGQITNNKKQASYKLDYILMNMLTYSDNTATNMIAGSEANTFKILNRVLSKVNLDLQEDMLVENKLTPEAVERVLYEIYHNQDKYANLIKYMKESIHFEWIKEGISNKEIASKYGQIPGVSNNIGIVYGPKGDYLLLVYTNNIDEAPTEIKNIASQIDKLHEDNN